MEETAWFFCIRDWRPTRGDFQMIRRLLIVAVVSGAALTGFGAGFLHAQNRTGQSTQPAPTATTHKVEMPPYHAGAPKEALADTLDPKQFPDAETQNIYAIAAKEKAVLYQEPCYCHCDKEVGHKSLLDCFSDQHGAHCMLCKKEAVFTYTESQQGKTAAQIRQEIVDGKWKAVDLTTYETVPPAK
jgi:hypothetical protein